MYFVLLLCLTWAICTCTPHLHCIFCDEQIWVCISLGFNPIVMVKYIYIYHVYACSLRCTIHHVNKVLFYSISYCCRHHAYIHDGCNSLAQCAEWGIDSDDVGVLCLITDLSLGRCLWKYRHIPVVYGLGYDHTGWKTIVKQIHRNLNLNLSYHTQRKSNCDSLAPC